MLWEINSTVPVILSAIFYLGSGVCLYLLATRLYDQKTGFIAALLTLTYSKFVLFGIIAMTESLYLFLVLCSLLVLVRSTDHPYLLGAFSGLAYLTRFNHWFLLAGILFYALKRTNQSRTRYATKFIIVFALILSPWLLRNVLVIGNPMYHNQTFELASNTEFAPGFTIYTMFNPPGPIEFLLTHPVMLIKKWFNHLILVYAFVPKILSHAWLLGLIASAEYVTKRAKNQLSNSVRIVTHVFLIGMGLEWFFQSFVEIVSRHLIPFLPIVFLLASRPVANLFEQKRRWFGYTILSILLFLNLFYTLQLNPRTNWNPRKLNQVQNFVPPGEPILTNIPQTAPWHTKRVALTMVPYETARQRYEPFDYALISRSAESLFQPGATQSFLRDSDFQRHFRILSEFSTADLKLFKRKSASGS